MASSLLIGLLVAVVFGVATTAYVWQVHRHRLEAASGIKIVAHMRWREFSHLVIDGLRARGFEIDPQNKAEPGQQGNIVLRQDDQTWLLACKQGVDYRITPEVVSEFSNAVHFHGAAGGVMVTPGRITGEARDQAGAIELIGGSALWPMLKPLLPASVRDSIATESGALGVRYVVIGWVAALAVGAGVAWLLPVRVNPVPPTPHAASGGSAAAGKPAAETSVAFAPAPLSEEERREQLRRDVSNLPGIDRALWSSRSTLLIHLADDSLADPLRSICAVVERYDSLRASRLQLQPAPGSQRPVRFLQCRVF